MGTSVEQIDRTYGHLLPDALERTRATLYTFRARSDERGEAEDEHLRLRRHDTGEVAIDFTWKVSRRTLGDRPYVILEATNPEGDTIRLGFPPAEAQTLGSLLAEES